MAAVPAPAHAAAATAAGSRLRRRARRRDRRRGGGRGPDLDGSQLQRPGDHVPRGPRVWPRGPPLPDGDPRASRWLRSRSRCGSPRSERDWYGMPDLGDPARIVALAALLATRVPPVAGPREADRMADRRRRHIAAGGGRCARRTGTFGDPPRLAVLGRGRGRGRACCAAPGLRRAALDDSDGGRAFVERGPPDRRAAGCRWAGRSRADVDDEAIRLSGFEAGLAGLLGRRAADADPAPSASAASSSGSAHSCRS